jgi:transposase InsO family protein
MAKCAETPSTSSPTAEVRSGPPICAGLPGSSITAIAAQYLSIRYSERLAEASILPSVGSVGDSYDNALTETVIGLFKTEVIRRPGPWRNLAVVEIATLEWVDWFNTRRLLEPIGTSRPPKQKTATMRTERRCLEALKTRTAQLCSGLGVAHNGRKPCPSTYPLFP